MPPPTILVVEDDATHRALFAELLCSEGYHVETAAEGAEALRAACRHRPGCILLDLVMPGLDGAGLAREVAARGLAVPLVVVSAAWDGRRVAEAIGAAGYLAKPFDLDELLATVARLCPPDPPQPATGPASPPGPQSSAVARRAAGTWT